MPPPPRRRGRVYSGPTDLPNRRTTVYRSPTLVAEFEMDRRGIARVAVSPAMQNVVRSAVVGRAMPYAIRISPRGRTLVYVSSWRAVDTFTVIAGMRRAACKLINVAPHAAAVEWGRGGRQGILRRVLSYLNSTSPIGLERAAAAARRSPWREELHPRGPGGRFAPSPATLRRRAQRASEIVD